MQSVLGIIILNYNTWQETITCVESIAAHIRYPYRIYLVDNCSPQMASEEQMAVLQSHSVLFVPNDRNDGYAAGNNIGLKKAYEDGCDLFLISNSDVIIEDDSIDKLCAFAKECPKAGAIGPVIKDVQGNAQPIHMLSKLTAAGKIKNMCLGTPLRPLFRKFEDSFVMRTVPNAPMKVFGVSGCCFLISRDCYEKVFPFDEHTFLYEEEYILGCRMEEKGIEAWYVPDAYIIHAEAVSTGGITPFSYKCLVDSEQYYLKEYLHTGAVMLWLLRVIRKINWRIKYKKQ